MGKAYTSKLLGMAQGRCLACKNLFVGPGQRCPKCEQELRKRKRRKPR
jgi:rRNA maturation endonuclease Nob1